MVKYNILNTNKTTLWIGKGYFNKIIFFIFKKKRPIGLLAMSIAFQKYSIMENNKWTKGLQISKTLQMAWVKG
jgi:hypothetical protein